MPFFRICGQTLHLRNVLMILIVFMSGNKFINIEFVAAGIGLQQRKFKHVMD
jgi:hypothetical protein